MFVITLTYQADLDVIDSLLDGHVTWLEEQYARGIFLASGRRVPRTGGLILAQGVDRDGLDEVLAADPFADHAAATYEVTEVAVSKAAPGLEQLLG